VVSTTADPVERDVSWFAVPRDSVRVLGEAESPMPSGGKSTIIDSGRRRLYRRLDRVAELAAIALEPAAVLRACEALQIKGLCFFATAADKAIALRVFTVSLAGREDASTGGAALGLSALLPSGEWTIAQGHGSALGRGVLRLKNPSVSANVAVGGQVEIVARGALAHP
jgi:predicted PhzF superfamily epimerase YddE/YHI9